MNTKTKQNTLRLATLGMLAALAVLLVALIHFPLIPAAPFLEYDPADVPILIGTFLYGPWAGLGLAGVVCIVQGVTVSAGSGPIGIFWARGHACWPLGSSTAAGTPTKAPWARFPPACWCARR